MKTIEESHENNINSYENQIKSLVSCPTDLDSFGFMLHLSRHHRTTFVIMQMPSFMVIYMHILKIIQNDLKAT